jgi:hypothetical protein
MHGKGTVMFRLFEISIFAVMTTLVPGCRAENEGDTVEQGTAEREEAESVSSASWLTVDSRGGAFSIRIPDGWRVYNLKSRDLVAAVGVEDMRFRSGVSPVVETEKKPLGDGLFRFSVYTSEHPYQPSRSARVTRKGFGPVDGVMGLRYTEDYPTGRAGESAWHVVGERDYYFVFSRRGLHYLAVYRVLPGELNRIMTVEKCVMTLQFGK